MKMVVYTYTLLQSMSIPRVLWGFYFGISYAAAYSAIVNFTIFETTSCWDYCLWCDYAEGLFSKSFTQQSSFSKHPRHITKQTMKQ